MVGGHSDPDQNADRRVSCLTVPLLLTYSEFQLGHSMLPLFSFYSLVKCTGN